LLAGTPHDIPANHDEIERLRRGGTAWGEQARPTSARRGPFWGKSMSLRSRAHTSWKLRRWLPTGLAIALGIGGPVTWVLAQPPAAVVQPGAAKGDDKKPAEPKAEPKKNEPAKDDKKDERLIAVSFDGAQWQEVLDWYAKESGLILVTTVRPTGNVTIKPPGAPRKFTLGEVTDLLNESMVPQKFILIRYSTTFTIWPVDEKLDFTLMPLVTPAELKTRGKTELVKCVIGPFKSIAVAEIRPEIEAMLTPFGKLQLLERSNSFQLSDKAGNILRIKQLLDDIEGTGDGGVFRHECKYKKAREGANLLKDLLKDNSTTVDSPMAAMPAYPVYGYPNPYQPGFGTGGGFDRRDRGNGGGDPRSNPYGSSGSSQTRGSKTVQIAVDDDKNALIVTAPEDKIVQAKKIIEEWDVGTPGQQPLIITPPVLKTYSVPAGTADATAKAIGERYPWIKITSIAASNQIMVVASADDHARVSQVLTGGDPVNQVATITKLLTVSGDPKELSVTLAKPFPAQTAGGPIIEPQSGGILFRGTPEQLRQIEEMLRAIEGPVGGVTGNRLQFTLDNGNAGILAEALGNAMKGMGKNPVLIQNLTGSPTQPQRTSPSIPSPSSIPAPGAIPPMPPPRPLPGEDANKKSERLDIAPGPRDPRFVLAQLVDPEAKNTLKPVVIRVIGNKLTIESDDPQALQLINDLIRLYVQQGTKVDENLFEVIKLKFVGADDAAKVITEVFNGPQQQQQGGRGGGGGGFNPLNLIGGLIGANTAPSGPPAPGRVRVVAEKSSNSLIVVKASPLDLLTMKKLLANVIDSGETDSDAVQRTFVIRLKNTEASDMAATIKELYRAFMTTQGGNQGIQGFPFPIPGAQQNNQQQRPPALAVSTDDRTNSLLIVSTKTLYEEVRNVVEMLDQSTAADNTEVVRVVPIKGIDPSLVQQMVDAMQGKDPNAVATRGTGFGNFGNNNRAGQGGLGQGFGGLGGGGFPGLGGGFGRGGGGGFPGMGGGGNFGGGGGNRGGGMGGGGNRGGGGGTRGGGRQSRSDEGRDPRNFDYRDMDVPSALVSTIYDPENDPETLLPAVPTMPRRKVSQILQTGALQPGFQPPPGPGGPPAIQPPVPGTAPGVGVAAPSGTVTAIPLSEAGVVVLRTTNPRDMEIVLELMEFIRKQAEGTEPELRLVPLKYQDCNSVAGTLNSIFARVQVGQTGNYVPPAARQVSPANLLTGLAGAPSTTQNVYCVAMPRFNALLIAGPKGRFADIIKEVERIDKPNDPQVQVRAIPLKKASAQVVALQLRQLYSQRFPSEGPPSMQFRINFDLASNSVLVTAAPADMKDIEDLIRQLDTMTSESKNDLRIFALRNAYADELASVLIQALTSNVINPLQQAQQQWYTQSVTQGNLGALGGIQALLNPGGQGQQFGQQGLQQQFGQLGQQFGLGQQFQGAAGQNQLGTGNVNLAPTVAQVGSSTGGGLATKTNALRFYSNRDGQVVETGFLEDVHIIPNTRTNALLVAAKPETMKLIEKLIDNLDTVAAARSYINIFTLKNADAMLTALALQQLFTGQSRTTLTPTGNAGAAGTPAAAAGTQGARPLLTVFGDVSPGAQLIDLRITVDDRTNSIIAAGSLNDLETIRTIIARLELSDTQQRQFDVYKLRNAAAADVATALQQFMTSSLAVYSGAAFNSAYAQLQRNVVIVPEPISNTIMISATPQYFAEMRRLIERIDAQPPQVMIQVLIAEVQLQNNEEVGVEWGAQSPVLFNRGGSLNFNTTSPLASSNVSPGVVGFQGLGNLGVGRSSATGQPGGGFIFAIQSNSLNLLVRALKAQGRIDILSRPQLHVADNQVGYINVGQNYPTPTGQNLTVSGSQVGVQYVPVGITMRVTPRVNPDGKVLMRVEPQVSSVATSTISIAPGVNAPIFNQETVETTVLAADGETIVIGGLISKTETRNEIGMPFFKDIPYVGALFRFRTQQLARREVIFIMTPHIVRTEYDAAKILAEESRRGNWCLPDFARIHGHGMEVMGPASQGAIPIPFGGTPPGMIPPGMLPAEFGPGFVPPNTLPGPGPETIPSYNPPPRVPGSLPPGGANNILPQVPQVQPSPATGGIPILGANGLQPTGATVQPGATPYIMSAGTPPVLSVPASALPPASLPAAPSAPTTPSLPTTAKNGYIFGSPAQAAPAASAPPSKEANPWAQLKN
jgi:type II secretory pathway component GspD/PulD (secretin)